MRNNKEFKSGFVKDYPGLISIVTRDYKTSGYDERPDAAPHAREVMQPMIMLEVAQQLLVNYNPGNDEPAVNEITDLMDSTDIYIVPVSNPDGLNYALYDNPNWRKTRCKIPKEYGQTPFPGR